MGKKIYISTYGCQMNDYESDRTFRFFREAHGYERAENPGEADLVLLNTCSVREKADQKAISEIGTLRALKEARPDVVIAVGGCLAQIQAEEIRSRFPHVDLVFGTHQWGRLPELLQRAHSERERRIEVGMSGRTDYSFLPHPFSTLEHPVAERVTVQNGCDKFCTFCLVPFSRGRQVSRPHGDVLEEIRSLIGKGVREVTLLGQNVNAYGEDRSGEIRFVALLALVAKVEGLRRIRFVTSHPSNLNGELVDAIAAEPKICPHLHLPVQSGSDRILSRMRREYTSEKFVRIAEELRSNVPGISLTTDFIVGFPSESEEDFQRTMDLLETVSFDDSFSFKYSPRPRTKAAEWTDEFVPSEVAEERLARLQGLQSEIRKRKFSAMAGEVVEVLVEGEAKRGRGLVTGRTPENRRVNFPGPPGWIGTLRRVRIREVLSNSFRGVAEGGA
jgi:tRNA-2-methylthio-N6-dimethylallyladenosine synthase